MRRSSSYPDVLPLSLEPSPACAKARNCGVAAVALVAGAQSAVLLLIGGVAPLIGKTRRAARRRTSRSFPERPAGREPRDAQADINRWGQPDPLRNPNDACKRRSNFRRARTDPR